MMSSSSPPPPSSTSKNMNGRARTPTIFYSEDVQNNCNNDDDNSDGDMWNDCDVSQKCMVEEITIARHRHQQHPRASTSANRSANGLVYFVNLQSIPATPIHDDDDDEEANGVQQQDHQHRWDDDAENHPPPPPPPLENVNCKMDVVDDDDPTVMKSPIVVLSSQGGDNDDNDGDDDNDDDDADANDDHNGANNNNNNSSHHRQQQLSSSSSSGLVIESSQHDEEEQEDDDMIAMPPPPPPPQPQPQPLTREPLVRRSGSYAREMIESMTEDEIRELLSLSPAYPPPPPPPPATTTTTTTTIPGHQSMNKDESPRPRAQKRSQSPLRRSESGKRARNVLADEDEYGDYSSETVKEKSRLLLELAALEDFDGEEVDFDDSVFGGLSGFDDPATIAPPPPQPRPPAVVAAEPVSRVSMVSGSGFATASGRHIQISDAELQKAQQLLKIGADDENDDLLRLATVPPPQDEKEEVTAPLAGFSTANGRQIEVSEAKLQQAQALLNKSTTKHDRLMQLAAAQHEQEEEEEAPVAPVAPTNGGGGVVGFATASGRHIEISDAKLQAAQTRLNTRQTGADKHDRLLQLAQQQQYDDDDDEASPPPLPPLDSPMAGFATASGRQIAISGTKLQRAQKLLDAAVATTKHDRLFQLAQQDDDDDNGDGDNDNVPAAAAASSSSSSAPAGFGGFALASGRKVHISDEKLQKAQQLLNGGGGDAANSKADRLLALATDHDDDDDDDATVMNSDTTTTTTTANGGGFGFALASGRKVNISDERLRKAEQLLLNNNSNKSDRLLELAAAETDEPEEQVAITDEVHTSVFQSANGNSVDVSRARIQQAQRLMSPPLPATASSSAAKMPPPPPPPVSTPSARKHIGHRRRIVSPATPSSLTTPEIPGSIQLNSTSRRARSRLGSSATTTAAAAAAGPGVANCRRLAFASPRRLAPPSTTSRQQPRQQLVTVSSKKPLPPAPKTPQAQSTTTTAAAANVPNPYANITQPRIRLSALGRPSVQTNSAYELQHVYGISVPVIEMTLSSAGVHRFVGVDGAQLGPEECHRTLVESLGALASCATIEWVENHYRYIVWKLASTERSYPQLLGGRYCTYTRVLRQLQYRYHVEFELAKRSCVRRILEHDDVASKYMVLCVSAVRVEETTVDNIADGGGGVQIELTDGWYAVPAQLDGPLCRLVRRRKIFVGQKLRIFGATLTGEPCAPLERPSSHLTLSYNGVRRARWDASLGYQKQPFFTVAWSTLLANGGLAPRVCVQVSRQLPMVYIETLQTEQRSGSNSSRSSNNSGGGGGGGGGGGSDNEDDDDDNNKNDDDSKNKKRRTNGGGGGGGRITRNQRAEDMAQRDFEMRLGRERMRLDGGDDEESRNNDDSSDNNNNDDETATPMMRNVTPYMQVRVRELLAPGSRKSEVDSGFITVWRPSEDMLQLFDEGKCLSLIGLRSAKKLHGDGSVIRMSTTSQTIVEELPATHPLVVANVSYRHSTRYNQPLFALPSLAMGATFDVVLVLLAVGTPITRMGRYRPETCTHLFFGGQRDDILVVEVIENAEQRHFSATARPQCKQLWNICDLQYRGHDTRFDFHVASASRDTVFTTRPHRNLRAFAISFQTLQAWMDTPAGQQHLDTQITRVQRAINPSPPPPAAPPGVQEQ